MADMLGRNDHAEDRANTLGRGGGAAHRADMVGRNDHAEDRAKTLDRGGGFANSKEKRSLFGALGTSAKPNRDVPHNALLCSFL